MISYFVIAMLAISIIVVMVLTIKFKIHPFIAMLLVAIFLAFTLHVPSNNDTNYITEISALIGKGFGNALASVGIIIVLGSVIGNILEMSGAALKLGEIVLRIVGNSHPALAMNILGFIVSIPVFCDSGYLILTPLRKAVAKKSGASPVALSVALSTGLYASHALIPPTPGPAAVVNLFGLEAHLLTIIIVGLIVAIPTSLVGAIYGIFISKYIKKPNYPDKSPTYETLISDIGGLPPTWKALAPIVVPILLMAIGSIVRFDSFRVGSGIIKNIFIFLGEPSMALFIGFLFSLLLTHKFNKEEISMWIGDGIRSSGSILAIVGASGAFAEVLKSTELAKIIPELGHIFGSLNMGLILPFIMASALKIMLGSSTIAVVTVASLFAPLLGTLGFNTPISQILVLMSIGAGSMIASHANDSYFWIVVELSGLKINDAYKARTLATFVQGITALIIIMILAFLFR
ncbi:GntP family permease [Brachyspira hyodysenteriae]|uniref:Gluconate transporter n=1 Tax=Brachyspira hyodysenteriae ATCC 27164 TaxID=1266923 RepID=A0A3B6VYK7_BRAHO|nr:gluconate transporter [Brachyspira hyodysenteriae]ANN62459.1 gluconate transporter [Brachyspira hyodysenteriae ATCC 27164]AUJ48699.1 gluconate transporter [Brachyspira hyodysenteriae]KLI17239.1 gluconate transporter [Brachyspira hyodysenteriae]KLI17682.1 gluconate transporter [Brachyspira hyodysenteriae]KLI21884.1 gluconate transporter [Brachyspira hyodysenteriae]